jgi:hypothetical protein
MKLAHLKKFQDAATAAAVPEGAPMRGTRTRHAPVSTALSWWPSPDAAGTNWCCADRTAVAWLIHAWIGIGELTSRERLRARLPMRMAVA